MKQPFFLYFLITSVLLLSLIAPQPTSAQTTSSKDGSDGRLDSQDAQIYLPMVVRPSGTAANATPSIDPSGPTATFTPTKTATPSRTPTPLATETLTPTATPVATLTATATPTTTPVSSSTITFSCAPTPTINNAVVLKISVTISPSASIGGSFWFSPTALSGPVDNILKPHSQLAVIFTGETTATAPGSLAKCDVAGACNALYTLTEPKPVEAYGFLLGQTVNCGY